ncbi:MAG: hypothetical protein IJU23_12090 [Proteobacteria bacterium]|nr:hypothetical protein [Pseudomonadota bacterium]
MKKLSLTFAIIVCMMLPLSANAKPVPPSPPKQPDIVNTDDDGKPGEFTREQAMLNAQALQAFQNGEYEKAQLIFEAMNSLGEFNVTWYQLGQAYARKDKCMEAYDAFHRVADAPILNSENPKIVAELTRKALAELDEQCSAKVVFKCEPEDTVLTIDNQREFKCSSEPVPVVPGTHGVHAKTSFGFTSITLDAVAGQVTETDVVIIDNLLDHCFDCCYRPALYTLERKSRDFKISGYTLLGAGIVGAGVSGGLMGYYNHKERRDSHQTDLKYTYAFLAISSAMAVTGAILLIFDAVKYEPIIYEFNHDECSSKGSYSLAPAMSPAFFGIMLNGRF